MMAKEDAHKSVTFTAYKRQRIVDAGDAVAFYTAVIDALETGHSLHLKRKADQELPHLVSSELELELAGTTVVVSDVSLNSVSDAKTTGTMPAILETDDVEAAVVKAVAAGAEADCGVKGSVTDPFGFNWIFISPAKESEKDHNKKVVFSGVSDMVLEVQSETGSAVKRRRMLHFDDHPMETSFYSSELSSIHESSAREEACDELLPEGSHLIEGFPAYANLFNDLPTLPMETSFYSSEPSSIHESSAREEAYDELLPEGSHLIEGFSAYANLLNDPPSLPMETSFYSSEPSSIHESSAREEACDELLPEGSHLIEGFPEWFAECLNDPVTPTLPDNLEGLDLYTANWYADCFNDPETPTQHDDLSFGSPKVQIDVSEYLNVSPETETREVRRPVTRYPQNVFCRGMKSFARPVTKLSSSISYPFTLVKPCGVHGDMTLKDINEKIRTPAAKPKEDKAEPPVIQTSVFSGKPVVGKTKFLTEGGNITVMRTRG